MYAVVEASSDRRSHRNSSPVELDRFADRQDAQDYIDLLIMVRCIVGTPSMWIEHCAGIESFAPVGRYRVARDGRAFVQVGRLCIWGRRGETERSLRGRKGDQIFFSAVSPV